MKSRHRLTTVLALAVAGLVFVARIVNALPLLTFDDPTPTFEDTFGESVAIDGNHILIGAGWDDTHGHDVGQAHLFDATTGTLLRTFDDPTPTVPDLFGASVALEGNRVLIGARVDSTNGFFVGQAHLFDATTGTLLRTFDDPTPTDSDLFGSSVALEGNRVLVGAPGASQAHLFDVTTGALLQSFDDPTPNFFDRFGESVAIDGNRVLINDDRVLSNDDGQAHLFDATTGTLLQTFDNPTPTIPDRFGRSVALEGNSVLIGAPADLTNVSDIGQAHLFDATTGTLLRTFEDPTPTGQSTTDQFGGSLALEGNHVLIGAHLDNTNGEWVGQAHLFDASTGALLQTFDDPTPTFQDVFGVSVAIDGSHILIGASGDDTNGVGVGQAHLFEFTPVANTVAIDIKPGDRKNKVNPKSRGGIWVALLSDTNPESPFDPPSQVDIPTVDFGPDGAKVIGHKVKDTNKDGLGDLLLRFKISETGIACGDTEAILTGETFGGQSITGTDFIKTVGCKPKKCHKKKHHKKHHYEYHDKKYHKMHCNKHHDDDDDDDHKKR
jgi:outer membrane protein assembly factor BamB